MSKTVIEVENVSKAFPLTKQMNLREEFTKVFKRYLLRKVSGEKPEQFYALKNISFNVQEGEAVAIIGRNGSGKSTLLRIMTRIMRPTAGYTKVYGRYTALIGLGAGFINTMTGRENIILNAAIHGISRTEIMTRIDDIIEFADIGQFIDMPVKDYSTGMNARLAFSVAIHILPDIIFLDEVLSVGDAAFQQKCMARINQLKRDQKTIVFVSHSEGAVKKLCERAVWIHQGEMMMDGPTDEVYKAYNKRFQAPKAPARASAD